MTTSEEGENTTNPSILIKFDADIMFKGSL